MHEAIENCVSGLPPRVPVYSDPSYSSDTPQLATAMRCNKFVSVGKVAVGTTFGWLTQCPSSGSTPSPVEHKGVSRLDRQVLDLSRRAQYLAVHSGGAIWGRRH